MKRATTVDVDPIGVERAFAAVARAITDKILTGEWPVGMSLPGEFALAKAFGVHRSTIRESIRVLEQDGLLIRPPGTKQLLVNAPSEDHVSSRMAAAIVLQEISFLDLWLTMLALEPASAEAAASNATAEDIAALEANQKATLGALKNPERLVRLDMAYLDAIASASQNRAIQLCRGAISELLYPAFLPVMKTRPAAERLAVAHGHILAAIKEGDAPRAKEWMTKHINDFRRGYEHAGLDIARPVPWPASLAMSAADRRRARGSR